jgi:hypothetical protein
MDGERIQLEDGRTLPANYRGLDHGDAITAYCSLGKAVDGEFPSAGTVKLELFYAGASGTEVTP